MRILSVKGGREGQNVGEDLPSHLLGKLLVRVFHRTIFASCWKYCKRSQTTIKGPMLLQGGPSCGKLASGWRGPTEFVRTKKLARLSSVGLRPSSVLSQCIFVAEMQHKKTMFASKIFSRECREKLNIRSTHFDSSTSQLVMIPRDLCRPAAMYNQSAMYPIQDPFTLILLSLNTLVNICVADGSEILIEAPKW